MAKSSKAAGGPATIPRSKAVPQGFGELGHTPWAAYAGRRSAQYPRLPRRRPPALKVLATSLSFGQSLPWRRKSSRAWLGDRSVVSARCWTSKSSPLATRLRRFPMALPLVIMASFVLARADGGRICARHLRLRLLSPTRLGCRHLVFAFFGKTQRPQPGRLGLAQCAFGLDHGRCFAMRTCRAIFKEGRARVHVFDFQLDGRKRVWRRLLQATSRFAVRRALRDCHRHPS